MFLLNCPQARCSCRDTLPGSLEFQRLLQQLPPTTVTLAELQRTLGPALFSFRASSAAVAEKVRPLCEGSKEVDPCGGLFLSSKPKAAAREKKLRKQRKKENSKEYRVWLKSKRKLAKAARKQAKKEKKMAAKKKKEQSDKAEKAYKEWGRRRKKKVYWSEALKAERPWAATSPATDAASALKTRPPLRPTWVNICDEPTADPKRAAWSPGADTVVRGEETD